MEQSSASCWDSKCLAGGAALALALAAGPGVGRMNLQLSLASEQWAGAPGGSGSLAGGPGRGCQIRGYYNTNGGSDLNHISQSPSS